MPVTMSAIIADSGSSVNDQSTVNEPTPSTVSSGIGGIQLANVTWWKRSSVPSSSTERPRGSATAPSPS